MNDLDISVDLEPSHSDIELLADGLSEHTISFLEKPGFRPIAVFAREFGGSLVGGAYGFLNWEWLDLSLLWVGSERRGNGLGSDLLSRIEAEAKERGCTRAHLDTFSYQARPFYEKHGYEVFAELQDYPQGHTRIFMKKRLHQKEDRL